ncbi:hypothetical protein AAEP93_007946 [Penicillium crustosum]
MRGIVQLTFINDKEDIQWLNSGNAARHRHPIFTDVERRDMTLEIISSVPDQNPDQAIVDLERFDSDISCSNPSSLFRGPFGAFRCPQPPQLEPSPSNTDELPPSFLDWFEQLEELPIEEDFNQSVFSLDALDALNTDYGESLISEEPSLEPPQSIGANFHELSLPAELNPYVSMIKGDPEMRRAYLVQTEKLICVKGLSQPALSANKRALHHCYAYMRIMAETTCIADRLTVIPSGTSDTLSDNTIYGGDFRVYPNLIFSTTTMSMEKDPGMAQRDLHLAIPGRWSSTLFPTLYGIDEIFLMLLSQVIRLANERDFSMMSAAAESRLSLKEFWTRAKGLENAIDHLLSTTNPSCVQPYDETLSIVMTATAQAMYTALSIFFHRRIYEIDPIMLQGKVAAIRGYLIQIQQEESHRKDSSNAALIWPAFITACEAVSPELQVFFSSWFDNCARTTALVHASVAQQIFETIWTKRRDVSLCGGTFSWPDILRDGDIKFMCI